MATSVSRQIAAIKKSADPMNAAAPATIETASAGDNVRQGDVYLVCLESVPKGEEIKDRQLAPGSTQGSRHVAVGDCRVIQVDQAAMATVINGLSRSFHVPSELVGPVIECRGDVTITHPEHGHRTLKSGTCWAVVYQRAYAEEIRRAQD